MIAFVFSFFYVITDIKEDWNKKKRRNKKQDTKFFLAQKSREEKLKIYLSLHYCVTFAPTVAALASLSSPTVSSRNASSLIAEFLMPEFSLNHLRGASFPLA